MLAEMEDLREFKIFAELDDRELQTIAKIAKTEELGAGARLTEAGATATNLYLVRQGRVNIYAHGPHGRDIPVDHVGPGDVVGWSTVTGPYLYTASSETAERSALVVINGNKLRQVFETNNHIGYRVLKGIGSVVAHRLAAIEAKFAAQGGESA